MKANSRDIIERCRFSGVVALALLLIVGLSLGCGRQASRPERGGEAMTMRYSKLLSIDDEGGVYRVRIHDPWGDSVKLLHEYLLVPREAEVPAVAEDVTVVRVPLERSLVYSAVHTGAIAELTGGVGAVAGVCDPQYFTDSAMLAGIAGGAIADCGNSMSPTLERVIDLSPDAILLSPYQNANYGEITKIGIPIVECADYMENTPLGRAEWIRFYGLLYGERERADSIFAAVESRYKELANKASSVSNKPKVITENVINGIWYVPGGDSYMAHMLADAGADYPWADNASSGSLQMDFAQVYDKAHDARYWLIKTFDHVTLASLKASFPLNDKMDAYSNGGVYACNTAASPLFTEFPYHPELLLHDFIMIFHPELGLQGELRYYHQVSDE